MSSEPKSLQEFFNKRVFRIPDYQRGYAWRSSHLEDFWKDLTVPLVRFSSCIGFEKSTCACERVGAETLRPCKPTSQNLEFSP